jgi:hypothetical protein
MSDHENLYGERSSKDKQILEHHFWHKKKRERDKQGRRMKFKIHTLLYGDNS